MKLLLYSLNFQPDLTGVGKYTGAMAAWLTQAGHDIHVITVPPYYPSWRVQAPYSSWTYLRERWKGVSIVRVPVWIPQNPSGLKRLLHLGSFALSSLPALAAELRWRPDVIFVVEPPLLCAPAALAFGWLTGAKTWLHVQDFEVDAAFRLALLKGRSLRSLVAAVERILMARFSRVSTISTQMLKLAMQKGVCAEKLVFLRNWVDTAEIFPTEVSYTYRAELHITRNAVVALYSGNMGVKQGLELLGEVASLLKDKKELIFVFCGDGPGRDALMASCHGLDNVRFLNLQPLARLNDLLGLADIHLLPQRADAADIVMPSKLTGMLASGRAIIATASAGTELATVIGTEADCGIVVSPECPEEMAAAIQRLADEPHLRARLGSNGRAYAEKELNINVVLGRLQKDLAKISDIC